MTTDNIIEEFVNGYCRKCDMARTAICEFAEEETGLRFVRVDCEYGTCPYGQDCEIMKKVFSYMKEKESC